MQRRQFTQITLAVGAVSSLSAVALLSNTTAQAQASKPQAGVDYLVLDKTLPTEATAGKVEVIEFFGYWCPHCNAFEPMLEQWIGAVSQPPAEPLPTPKRNLRKRPENRKHSGRVCGSEFK